MTQDGLTADGRSLTWGDSLSYLACEREREREREAGILRLRVSQRQKQTPERVHLRWQ